MVPVVLRHQKKKRSTRRTKGPSSQARNPPLSLPQGSTLQVEKDPQLIWVPKELSCLRGYPANSKENLPEGGRRAFVPRVSGKRGKRGGFTSRPIDRRKVDPSGKRTNLVPRRNGGSQLVNREQLEGPREGYEVLPADFRGSPRGLGSKGWGVTGINGGANGSDNMAIRFSDLEAVIEQHHHQSAMDAGGSIPKVNNNAPQGDSGVGNTVWQTFRERAELQQQ